MNKPEFQDYDGPMPKKSLYDPDKMMTKDRNEFEVWYSSQVKENVRFNFKNELEKYCNADVDLLAKAVFEFRDIVIQKTETDPFSYITLASLCKAIFIDNDLPERSIVGNEANKKSSQVGREWLYYVQQQRGIDMYEETPTFFEYNRLSRSLKCNIMGRVTMCIVPPESKFKYPFIPPAVCFKTDFSAHITVDGYHKESNTAFEFQGCRWHGCPNCTLGDEGAKKNYEQTQERIMLLNLVGIKVESMWDCEWKKLKRLYPIVRN
jgi:hypothetical protein